MPDVTVPKGLFAALCVFTALILQITVLARLPAPGGRPDLVLVVVVAFALAQGPLAGMLVGFGGGLAVDLVGVHPLGLVALVLTLVGYLAGQIPAALERSVMAPMVLMAVATVGATLLYAGLGAALGDPRVTWSVLVRSIPPSVGYNVLLTPFVVPGVAALTARLEHRPRRG